MSFWIGRLSASPRPSSDRGRTVGELMAPEPRPVPKFVNDEDFIADQLLAWAAEQEKEYPDYE